MKKKIISSVFALALLATAGWGVNKSMNSDANLSDLALANVEALAGDESGGSNYNICYSESRVKVGYTYYDCGDCPNKVYDEKGRGTYSKCFY